MVGPVGSGIQQQIPAANTFQPGGNTQESRESAETRQGTETRPVGTSAAEAQGTETRNNGESRAESLEASARGSERTQSASGGSDRGSVVDITV